MRFACRILFVITSIILSSCGTHKMHFDCKASSGMGCKSVSEVNESVDNTGASGRVSLLVHPLLDNNLDNSLDTNPNNNLDSSVSRTKEKTLKIWVNNYVDSRSNFRGEQYIYTVVNPSKWEVK